MVKKSDQLSIKRQPKAAERIINIPPRPKVEKEKLSEMKEIVNINKIKMIKKMAVNIIKEKNKKP